MGARTGHIVVAGDFNCGIEAQYPIMDALRSADMQCLGGFLTRRGAPLSTKSGPLGSCWGLANS
eukprot:6095439-Alexandrium_andersonii.AAC.1